MEGFIITFLANIYCSLVLFCFYKSSDSSYSSAWMIGGVILAAIGLAFMIQASIDSKDSGPCIAYEERSVYDPALKIMRKADVCVERGVWKE